MECISIRQIGDDEDSLTEMTEAAQAESFSYNNVRFQRNVTSLPTWRKTLRNEKNSGYLDFKNLK